MRHWLGPYVFADEPIPGWHWPVGAVAAVDLRPLDDQSSSSPSSTSDRGWFVTPTGVSLPAEYEEVPADFRPARIRQRLRLRSTPTANSPAGLLAELLTRHARADGDGAARPLMPGSRGRLSLVVARSILLQTRFRIDGADVAESVEMFRANYKKLRLLDETLARKWLGYQVLKLRLTGNQYEALQPAEHRGEEPLPPDTTYTENFNGSDSSSLGNLLTWSNDTSTWEQVSNQARSYDSNAGSPFADRCARAEHDTSSDDMYAQADVQTMEDAGGNTQAGAAVRVNSSARTTYYMTWANQGVNDNVYLGKFVSGTYTTIDGPDVITVSLPQQVYCEANGSTIIGKWDATEYGNTTDTAITANTRGGLYSYNAVANTDDAYFDDFETGDLAAAAGQPWALRDEQVPHMDTNRGPRFGRVY